MDDLLIALISAFADLIGALTSSLFSWGSPCDGDLLFDADLGLVIVCLGWGYWTGWLSTLVVKHAVLHHAWMRGAALLGMPPLAGCQANRLLAHAPALEPWYVSRSFWLPYWFVLAFCAGRLVYEIR